MSYKWRFLLLLIVVSLFCGNYLVKAKVLYDDFILVAENDKLALYARFSDGQLIILDLASEKMWFSNPDVTQISGFMMLSDVWQGNLQSPFYLDYFDKRRNVRGANAYFGNPEIEFDLIDDGFAMSYYFETTGIGFTIEYTLESDSLLAVVPWDKLEIGNGDLQILSLRILPFLGAQTSESLSGYMVVPDGSGGLVYFKEQVAISQTGYNQWLYGLDPASAEPAYDPYREPVVTPIYGLKSEEQAFLGIVEQGQESAKVLATPAGVITNYNWVSSEFWYSQSIMMRTSRQEGGIRVFDENAIPGDRSVRFYFLADEDANYVNMAQIYRQYLIDKQGATRLDKTVWDAPIMIEILGADYETNIFGPVMQPVTTFAQTEEIVDLLIENQVTEMIVNYRGWNRMGIHGSLPRRLPPEKTLGGSDGLSDLAKYLNDLNVMLFLEDDYTVARGSNNGFQPSSQASRTRFNDLISFSTRSLGSGTPNVTTYLITPRESLLYAKRDIPLIAEYGISGMKHLTIGADLNSDHNPNADRTTQRRETRLIYRELIGMTKEHLKAVGITTGNAYLIDLVDVVTEVPIQATADAFIDTSIPFYQIATHGLITAYGLPLNLSINPTDDLLRMVEYGVLPSFVLSAEPSWNLRYTLSSNMYSTYYLDWFHEVVGKYEQVNTKLRLVHDQFIVDHQEVAPNLYRTEYENGIAFLVNYSKDAFDYQGTVVMGNSFVVIDEEGQIR